MSWNNEMRLVDLIVPRRRAAVQASKHLVDKQTVVAAPTPTPPRGVRGTSASDGGLGGGSRRTQYFFEPCLRANAVVTLASKPGFRRVLSALSKSERKRREGKAAAERKEREEEEEEKCSDEKWKQSKRKRKKKRRRDSDEEEGEEERERNEKKKRKKKKKKKKRVRKR